MMINDDLMKLGVPHFQTNVTHSYGSHIWVFTIQRGALSIGHVQSACDGGLMVCHAVSERKPIVDNKEIIQMGTLSH